MLRLQKPVDAVGAERWLHEGLPQTNSGTEEHLVTQAFKDEAIVWDLPLRFHAPKLLLWYACRIFHLFYRLHSTADAFIYQKKADQLHDFKLMTFPPRCVQTQLRISSQAEFDLQGNDGGIHSLNLSLATLSRWAVPSLRNSKIVRLHIGPK